MLLSGIYSAFPYVFLAFVIPAGGFVADMMRKKISTIIVRKIMTVSGKSAITCHEISDPKQKLFY